jgi:hypothetical protein
MEESVGDSRPPTVSVCIPAYKRPIEIRRAIASVFAQTYTDWELVISDDEDPPGETWDYLRQLATQDSRVRVMQNPGPHGQVPNMNRALVSARGTWVKPLHHDDALRPECLETILRAVRGQPSVVIVSCLFDRYVLGSHVATLTRRGREPLELVPSRYVHLGMYLQDCSAGLPTQIMAHRKAIERGALFEDVPGVISSVDVLWSCALSRLGDLLLVNKVLVELHQDARTITASMRAGQLESEYPIILGRELECIDPSLKPPRLEVVLQMTSCLRAISHFKAGRTSEALKSLLKVRYPYAWLLIARWLLSQAFPGRFHVAPRIPVMDQQ